MENCRAGDVNRKCGDLRNLLLAVAIIRDFSQSQNSLDTITIADQVRKYVWSFTLHGSNAGVLQAQVADASLLRFFSKCNLLALFICLQIARWHEKEEHIVDFEIEYYNCSRIRFVTCATSSTPFHDSRFAHRCPCSQSLFFPKHIEDTSPSILSTAVMIITTHRYQSSRLLHGTYRLVSLPVRAGGVDIEAVTWGRTHEDEQKLIVLRYHSVPLTCPYIRGLLEFPDF
jgi:hypothetical protein